MPTVPNQTLDLLKVSQHHTKHHTQSKVISGAVLITYNLPGSSDADTIMLESMTEPSEGTVGTAAPVNILHLLHPLEWVAPAYNGGTVNLTLIETWEKSPYEELGFTGVKDFFSIINHEAFAITVTTYIPRGGKKIARLMGCRVTGPIVPTGSYARGTTTRTMNVPVGYTRLIRD